MIEALMYSGGVDSVLCLKMLAEQGKNPFLFYMQTYKLKDIHVEMAKKIAKILSPKSPLYIFKPFTINYNAIFDEHNRYVILMNELHHEKVFNPLDIADKIYIGYFAKAGKYPKECEDVKLYPCGQERCIELIKKYQLPIEFPLENMRLSQLDKMFNELPDNIKNLVVSSTRKYHYGGKFVE